MTEQKEELRNMVIKTICLAVLTGAVIGLAIGSVIFPVTQEQPQGKCILSLYRQAPYLSADILIKSKVQCEVLNDVCQEMIGCRENISEFTGSYGMKMYKMDFSQRKDKWEKETDLLGAENIIITETLCFPPNKEIDIPEGGLRMYSFPNSKAFCMAEGDALTVVDGTLTIVDDPSVITVTQNRTYRLSELKINFTRVD